jgi:hypothetical protein
MLHLSHANKVIAGRGISGFLVAVFADVSVKADFDAVVSQVAASMKKVLQAFAQIPHEMDESFFHQEIMLVGWSKGISAREAMLQQVARIRAEAPHIPAGDAMLAAELPRTGCSSGMSRLSSGRRLASRQLAKKNWCPRPESNRYAPSRVSGGF